MVLAPTLTCTSRPVLVLGLVLCLVMGVGTIKNLCPILANRTIPILTVSPRFGPPTPAKSRRRRHSEHGVASPKRTALLLSLPPSPCAIASTAAGKRRRFAPTPRPSSISVAGRIGQTAHHRTTCRSNAQPATSLTFLTPGRKPSA